MTDRYLIKWSLGRDEYPVEVRSTEPEALARIRELFIEHGQALDVDLCLNDLSTVLYSARILKKWNRGEIQLR
jgi:hypothetical protein